MSLGHPLGRLSERVTEGAVSKVQFAIILSSAAEKECGLEGTITNLCVTSLFAQFLGEI